MKNKILELFKVCSIFLLLQFLTLFLIPEIFMYTAGVDETIKQVTTMSNISQCIMVFIGYYFVKNNENISAQNTGKKYMIFLYIIGICASLGLAIFNHIYYDGVDLVSISITNDGTKVHQLYHYDNYKTILLYLITYAIIPAVCEEVFYRKMIESRLNKYFSTMSIIVISGIFFSIAHFSSIKLFPTFIFGILLMFCYTRYKRLSLCVVIHFMYNIVDILIETVLPLSSNSIYISEKYTSAKEAMLDGIRYISIGILLSVLVVYFFISVVCKFIKKSN